MFTFNNTHMFTGYLKQVLKDFNLPKFKVYTKEQTEYFAKYGKELNVIGTVTSDNKTVETDASGAVTGFTSNYNNHMKYIPYIRNGMIQEYINGKWVDLGSYIENDKVVIGKSGNDFIYENTTTQKALQHNTQFVYDVEYLNYTKNLIIKDNVYDSYTHEYLGDYLRFLRDYNDLNLMPLYNCFSNNVCEKIKLSGTAKHTGEDYKLKYNSTNAAAITTDLDIKNLYFMIANDSRYYSVVEYYNCDFVNKAKVTDDEKAKLSEIIMSLKESALTSSITLYEKSTIRLTGEDFTFDSDNTNYKLYLIPVKLFQKYTIAIDSALPIEMCCVMYGDYQDKRTKFSSSTLNIAANTYKKVSQSHFNQPFIYDKLSVLTAEALNTTSSVEIVQNEDDLKLLLKVPVSNDSTIVILEGDYRNWNDTKYVEKTVENIRLESCSKNYTIVNIDNISDYDRPKLITELQLLRMNIRKQVPFANRLIEYMTGNAISSQENISDNIERAQTLMLADHHNLLKGINRWTPGVWTDQMRILAYEYMQMHLNDSDVNKDVLGYIDKDIEQNYSHKSTRTNNTTNISNADIYQEENMWRRITNGKY